MLNIFGEEIKTGDYTTFEEMKLPFGNCVCMTGKAYREFEKDMMESVNVIRRMAKPIESMQAFNETFPTYAPNAVSDYCRKHWDRCKTFTQIDTSNVIFWVTYDEVHMRFTCSLNISACNSEILEQKHLKDDIFYYHLASDFEHELDEKIMQMLIEEGWMDKMEFIPIQYVRRTSLDISHKAYRTSNGYVKKAVNEPYYGYIIKTDTKTMQGLEDWLEQGGKIKDDRLYLVCASKDDRTKLYLRKAETEVAKA